MARAASPIAASRSGAPSAGARSKSRMSPSTPSTAAAVSGRAGRNRSASSVPSVAAVPVIRGFRSVCSRPCCHSSASSDSTWKAVPLVCSSSPARSSA